MTLADTLLKLPQWSALVVAICVLVSIGVAFGERPLINEKPKEPLNLMSGDSPLREAPDLQAALVDLKRYAHMDTKGDYPKALAACEKIAAIARGVRDDIISCAPGARRMPRTLNRTDRHLLILDSSAYDREAVVNYGEPKPTMFLRNKLLDEAVTQRQIALDAISSMHLEITSRNASDDLKEYERMSRDKGVEGSQLDLMMWSDLANYVLLIQDDVRAETHALLELIKSRCDDQAARFGATYQFEYAGYFHNKFSPSR